VVARETIDYVLFDVLDAFGVWRPKRRALTAKDKRLRAERRRGIAQPGAAAPVAAAAPVESGSDTEADAEIVQRDVAPFFLVDEAGTRSHLGCRGVGG
jgi:hypothetical protein